MPVSGNEIASLDFANLIGGPLEAIVQAQANAGLTTADFINQVGFDKNGNVVNVDFSYTRKGADGKDQEFTLTVPFLTMVPLPYIRIEDAQVNFNAKITSTTEKKDSSSLGVDASLSVAVSRWGVTAQLTAKTSYQKKSATNDKEERSFDMRIAVKAKSIDLPEGTERLLSMLEKAISEEEGPVVFTAKVVEFATDSLTLKDAESVKSKIDAKVKATIQVSNPADGKKADYTLSDGTDNKFKVSPSMPADALPPGSTVTVVFSNP